MDIAGDFFEALGHQGEDAALQVLRGAAFDGQEPSPRARDFISNVSKRKQVSNSDDAPSADRRTYDGASAYWLVSHWYRIVSWETYLPSPAYRSLLGTIVPASRMEACPSSLATGGGSLLGFNSETWCHSLRLASDDREPLGSN
jgi:hypothetical protein